MCYKTSSETTVVFSAKVYIDEIVMTFSWASGFLFFNGKLAGYNEEM